MKTSTEIYNELSLCKDDTQRWNCVIINRHQKNMPVITLDNDYTCIEFEENEETGDEYDVIDFDDYLGWSEGVQTLLSVIGIKAEPC